MFDEWRERRKLRDEISVLEKKTAGWDWRLDEWFDKDSEQAQEQANLRKKLYSLTLRFEAIETERLIKEAVRLGIDFPEKPEWWRKADGKTFENFRPRLNQYGRVAISKLIRDERRKNIEWWVKTITPLLGALISLLGLVVALVSVGKK
ncbi:MAG: hypothetical protein M3416_04435 [Acidobacteriota bacterium]|nr:hypothetical protein [Acidobacteriota bacterium]